MNKLDIVKGDLLDQDVETIVNAWNRNIIPWWLLLPQGSSADAVFCMMKDELTNVLFGGRIVIVQFEKN